MKTKIVVIAILATLVLGSLSASGLTIQKTGTQDLSDPTPEIYFIAVHSSGKHVDWGYTNIMYAARSRNEIGGEVDMVFDWGDGTTSTYSDVGDWVDEGHEYTRSGTFSVKVRYGEYNSW